MFALLAIPIVSQVTGLAQSPSSFFDQPIDVILYDFLIWFGWIPIVITLGWGFTEMWLNYRRGIYVGKLKFTVLAIDVPSMTEQTPKAFENLFASLYATKSSITWKEKWFDGKLHPVFSFEIISTEGYIQFLVRTQTRFRDVIEAGIYANYPEAEISEVEDYAKKFPNEYPNDDYEMWGGEVTLENDDMFPIRTHLDFEDRISQEIKDPLSITLEQLGKMRPGEHFWIQMLVQPSSNDWQKKSIKFVNKLYGVEDKQKKSAFLGALESTLSWPAGLIQEAVGLDVSGLLGESEEKKEEDQWKAFKVTLAQKEEAEAVLRKASKIGLGVKIRVLYVARKNAFVKVERTSIVKGVLNQFSNLNLNKFTLYIPQVPKDDYFWMRLVYTKKQHRLMSGYQGRSWGAGANPIVLNVEELATLWHFPPVTIKAPLVKKSESKRAEPPSGLPITFSDEVLPGYVPPESEREQEGLSLPHMDFPEVSDEPLPETLPHPHAPVLHEPSLKEKLTKEPDGYVPPNLPI
ncbi:hypothetical protein EPN81_02195 [Patescibacteria group bacterium]|nr:MAG: hypothetical protein EPN81_02195 [Patescibacteria group bacterium]